MRHFAADTLFFSSDCFLFPSSGAHFCLSILAAFRVNFFLRLAEVILVEMAFVFGCLGRTMSRFRCPNGGNSSEDFPSSEAVLTTEFILERLI